MQEPDDRLAGDLVWELFPEESRPRAFLLVAVPILLVETWFLDPPSSVVLACLAVSWGDFDRGRKIRRAIPDRAAASICSLFTHAWGAEKIGVAGVAIMYVTFLMAALRGKLDPCPREIPTAMIRSLWAGSKLPFPGAARPPEVQSSLSASRPAASCDQNDASASAGGSTARTAERNRSGSRSPM